jgi:hypothetical protein
MTSFPALPTLPTHRSPSPASSLGRPVAKRSIFDPFGLNDYEHRKRRRQLFVALVLGGLAIAIGLTALVRSVAVPKVERHLKDDVVTAVAADVSALRVDVDGRNLTIAGSVASVRERNRIVSLVRERWGVGSVDADGLRVG